MKVAWDKYMHSSCIHRAEESSSLWVAFKPIIPPSCDSLAFCSILTRAVNPDGLRHAQMCKIASARTVYEAEA